MNLSESVTTAKVEKRFNYLLSAAFGPMLSVSVFQGKRYGLWTKGKVKMAEYWPRSFLLLPTNKSHGLYSCPVRALKSSSNVLSRPLAHIKKL